MPNLLPQSSVKARILVPFLGALFLFIAGYTLFWSSRYTHQLETTFEEEIVLAPHFLMAPIVDALKTDQLDVVDHTLHGLETLSFTEFARVIVDGEVVTEFLAIDSWLPHWDGAIGRFDLTSHQKEIHVEGHEAFIAEPLKDTRGNLVGQLIIGFSRAEIEAKIMNAYMNAALIGAVSFLIFAGLALVLSSSITGPLNRIVALIDRMRDGDTDWQTVDGERRDEFGKLGHAVEEFRDNLIERKRLEAEEAEAQRRQEALTRKLAEEEKAREEEARKAQAERDTAKAQEAQRRAEEQDRQRLEREAQVKRQQQIVRSLATGLAALADGKLNHRIDTPFPEGYDQLRIDFNRAIGALQVALSSIGVSGGEINRNSGDISASALDLARRTETSAATLEQTAAALDSLTKSVRQGAEGANRADVVVREIRAKSQNSGEVVRNAVTSMAGIKESSDRIAKVIEVIDGIAFQTNLLALNAGVEAARAGEAGRGFAVVASEVRDLSQRTAEAAREVGDLIRSSTQEVEHGVRSVNEAGNALDNILVSVREISDFVSEIATSAAEQSSGISEINTAITQLDQNTQQNAAMFEQTTAVSQSLNAEAETLARALAHFEFDLDSDTAPEDAYEWSSAQNAHATAAE